MATYKPVLSIPTCYVVEVCDAGALEHDDGEKDDLRLAIELSAGHKVILQGKQRFYVADGYLVIEDLV